MNLERKIEELVITRKLAGRFNVSAAVVAHALIDEDNNELPLIVRASSLTLTDAQIKVHGGRYTIVR